MTGSSALGVLVGATAGSGAAPALVTWAGAGFLRGFTTFSTFTYETVRLIGDGAWRYVIWNLALSGPLAFAAAGLRYAIFR